MRKCWLIFVGFAVTATPPAPAADRTVAPIVSRIHHTTVESHGVAAVGYSKRLHALEIEFRHGGTYRYLDVPPSVHREMLECDSTARYYNTHIRGRYRSVRVRSTNQEHP
ncbi:MAG: KTSC domain-containing protein [Chthoniobacterales bacterium]